MAVKFRPLRVSKRLNFDFSESEEEQDLRRVTANIDNEQDNTSLNFSPCRTRSGLVCDMETSNNTSHDLESFRLLPLSDFGTFFFTF